MADLLVWWWLMRRCVLLCTCQQYLLVCAMEFARNVMLAPHIFERYNLPDIVFTHYESFQVAVMALQVGFLIVRGAC